MDLLPVTLLIKHQFLPSEIDIHQQSRTDHIHHERAAAITDKRKRNPSDRHDAKCHSYINENLEEPHGKNAACQKASETIP